MGAQHTPGPWHVDGHEKREVRAPGRSITVVGNMATASGYPESERRPHVIQAQADARLIAAAPELLAVLQSLMPAKLIGEGYETPVPDDEPLREFLFTWGRLRAARAAIAKATGQ